MTLTPRTLTLWRNPLTHQRFARVRQVIADQPPRGLARRGGAAALPPGGTRPPPPDARARPPAAPCGSIEQAARKVSALQAQAQLLTGAGE